MPEVCEIIYTAQYLFTKLRGRFLSEINVLSGRYTHEKLYGSELINKKKKLKIVNIDNKGKFMWFELINTQNNKHLYILNTFGLTGSWEFTRHPTSRVQFVIENKYNTKKYYLYFNDARNFGTLKITSNVNDLNDKLNKLERDFLKTEFTNSDFINWVNKFKYKNTEIIKILMSQDKPKSLGCGLGNYLAPEILYKAHISPFRKLDSLSIDDLNKLAHSIRYILRLCYENNKIGYMELFKNFVDKHKKGIIDGKFPVFHKNTKIPNKEFTFNVYRQKTDPLGNPVIISKIIDDRSTYWVPNIQK